MPVSAVSSVRTISTAPGCVARAEVFTDTVLENPPSGSAPAGERRRYAELSSEAKKVCLDCPLVAQCLYRAVVVHDVAGFVAGTTERQRLEIRRRLGITVEPEDFDTLAGIVGGHRQIDHDEVVRLRRANPHESLERLAQRLGCSLSTVKRHLRQERSNPSPAESEVRRRPTLAEVLRATAAVLAPLQTLAA